MKINSIYDMIGNVDDKYVSEAETAAVKKKRPIALVIAVCAAAAAALSMIVGARINIKKEPFVFEYYVNGSEPARAEVMLTAKKFTVPEEFIPLFEDDMYYRSVKTLDEFNDIFGIEPLIIRNENFTTIMEDQMGFQLFTSPVLVGDYLLSYYYDIQDKNIGEHHINIEENHFNNPLGGSSHIADKDDSVELLTLNDGSPCVIAFYPASPGRSYSLGYSRASFVYNGSLYDIDLWETDDEPGTIEHVKTVLKDLGVL